MNASAAGARNKTVAQPKRKYLYVLDSYDIMLRALLSACWDQAWIQARVALPAGDLIPQEFVCICVEVVSVV